MSHCDAVPCGNGIEHTTVVRDALSTSTNREERGGTSSREASYVSCRVRAFGCCRASHYLASACGRSWNLYALLVVPLPPSMWKGARVLMAAQSARPFQPAFGSSMRPSSHFV